MRYFYMKIGNSNSLAGSWLSGENPLKRPAVVIFFGKSSVDDIRNGKSDPQARQFVESSLKKNREHIRIVVVGKGNCWILQPSGNVIEYRPSLKDGHNLKDLWKILPVNILTTLSIRDIPPVLAGINAHAYLGRGTYRELGKTNWGNIKAIHSVLGEPLPAEHLEKINCQATNLFECLSSVELETLVAKLFESQGCFVPAYRGSYIQDVDLFIRNENLTSINLNGLYVPPNSSITLQVKRRLGLRKKVGNADHLIALDAPVLNAEWLLEQIKEIPSVSLWLKKSLSWLSPDFLSNYSL
ncbi:MAG: hypothetical protein HND47_08855 [Chloroflexi bacterium]|nr:hypothetical protein [Chloroflexota bacterium]